jgi:hypothetical protein
VAIKIRNINTDPNGSKYRKERGAERNVDEEAV